MPKRLLVAVSVCLLAPMNWAQFPGHTYLQSDTQIYAPILEHLSDQSVLAGDMLVERTPVSFTLYDEMTNGLRHLTGLSLRDALFSEQIIFRALGIWGLYLAAEALGLAAPAALLVAAIVSLGATISGPAVLTFEYEPVPRGFAVPLLYLAIGLAAQARYLAAGVAGAVSFLVHPPTVYPFWAIYLVLALSGERRRRLAAFVPLAVAVAVLLVAAWAQAGTRETQAFFTRIGPEQERLMRWRASYNWISVWAGSWALHYITLYAATLVLASRLREVMSLPMRYFVYGLPILGLSSMPLSYLLLEGAKWGLIPQVQPMRAVLFITLMAQLLAAAAGCRAAAAHRFREAILCFALAYWIPVNTKITGLPRAGRLLVIAAFAAAAALAAWDLARRRAGAIAAAAVAIAAFFAIPTLGKVTNYPSLHNAELDRLAAWARNATPKSAVFLFPDAGQELYPGIFRAEALRPVYVDWKSGGQVNYFRDFGEKWWVRWNETMARPGRIDPARDASLGIDYVVVKAARPLEGRQPVYWNSRFLVYTTR